MACIRFDNNKHGSVGCTIGLRPDFFVGAFGADPVEALSKASSLAADMDKLLKDNPALAAVIPPQVTAAMKAISAASWALQHGKDISEVASKVGPAAASFVTSILRSVL